MLARFEDQVAIVTGGAAGIGRAIVERLADDGATVVVADINEKDGREVAEAIIDENEQVEQEETVVPPVFEE